MRFFPTLLAAFLVLLVSPAFGQTNRLILTPGSTRSGGSLTDQTDALVRQFARNTTALTRASREARSRATGRSKGQFSMPARVEISGLPPVRSRVGGGINLVFETSGARAFPSAYKTLLQTTFDNAESTLNLFFGSPQSGGDVYVRNYDADISDRDAVSGGYYLPNNGSGQREIRFPVYLSNEAAAVNFIHAVLLAYQGSKPYGLDAFQEGLVRAATMRVVRTPSATPGLDQDKIEEALGNSYDVGAQYDWFNQRALGGPRFIANNLRDTPLPSGGSLGGVYLLRYLMAGSAWQKVLAEYPTFIANFNNAYYSVLIAPDDAEALLLAAQAVLNTLRPSDPTIEGYSFAEWAKRQFILETTQTAGLKLLVEPIPITSGLASTDFGVYLIQATYFSSQSNGDETLLSGTSYPIFWDRSFNRIFPDSQSERMDIAGAYGSVVPNFPDQNAGKIYRVVVDIPVQDQIARAYLPAGAVATSALVAPRDFYGSVIGVVPAANSTLKVRVTIGSEVIDNIPVTDNAFGALIGTSNYLGARSLVIDLIQVVGTTETVLLTRRVNKGPGALAVNLNVGADSAFTFGSGIPKGLSLVGFPVDPFASTPSGVLGIGPSIGALIARYNASRAKYELAPEVEPFKLGLGHFVRLNQAIPTLTVPGRVATTATAVALRPGWNLVTTPLGEAVPSSRVTVVRAANFPRTYAEAAGEDVGLDFFGFVPGANDTVTGAPETGGWASVTAFEPGKAYFVRCLAPEGVTLLFNYEDNGGRSVDPRLQPQFAYSVRAELGRKRADVVLGLDPKATLSFDRGFDSDLPPSVGGLQVVSAVNQYRDVRSLTAYQTFEFRVDGLKKGDRYSLVFDAIKGDFDRMTLIESTGRRTSLFRGHRLPLRATGPSASFKLIVEGAR
ncbi:MAG: hypothetical protein ACOYON_12350 [Fimbriimonas sp.]